MCVFNERDLQNRGWHSSLWKLTQKHGMESTNTRAVSHHHSPLSRWSGHLIESAKSGPVSSESWHKARFVPIAGRSFMKGMSGYLVPWNHWHWINDRLAVDLVKRVTGILHSEWSVGASFQMDDIINACCNKLHNSIRTGFYLAVWLCLIAVQPHVAKFDWFYVWVFIFEDLFVKSVHYNTWRF